LRRSCLVPVAGLLNHTACAHVVRVNLPLVSLVFAFLLTGLYLSFDWSLRFVRLVFAFLLPGLCLSFD
jgi:hypothetical protein